MRPRYAPIEDYGVIGDLDSVALVGKDGSIDFMCFPYFDSPTIFARLLDADKGGFFRIAPVGEECQTRQLYMPQSCTLLTRFLSPDGVAEVSDFMPIFDICPSHDLVRRVKCIRGRMRLRMECRPAFNYARSRHRVERGDGCVVMESEGPDKTAIRLRCPRPFEVTGDGAVVSEFELGAGESAAFILEEAGEPGCPAQSEAQDFVPESFKATLNYWRRWVADIRYTGRWREMMERSALTLKLLTSHRHGSFVAAPTFGLPEEIGGVRNWDYRYTWIRDSSFSLYALIRLGHTQEAAEFMRWIEARCGELDSEGSLRIMYGLDGRHTLVEEDLGHLEGYMGSRPVRIGNGAHDQLQLDIYGELMDAVYLYDKHAEPVSYDLWSNLVRLIDWVVENWDQPDEGIWEVRGGKQRFLFSRVLCWVAVDRGVRLAMKRSLPAPLDKWIRARNHLYQSVFDEFWDPKLKAFTQYKGARTLDASALLMPLVRFIGPKDPRWLSTLRAIERELVEDSLVYRYRNVDTHDGLPGEEGTFSMCSFWYVECLSRAGDVEKARFQMEKMLGYANHLGLYAEELGPHGEHLGNFPQAFTHLGFISAAFDLDRRLDGRV